LTADEPIFQAKCTGVFEFEGNSYNLTKGQYYLNGEWFEMLNGNKNWYVLTKYPEGQGNKCIVSLESILDMNLDMNKDDENVPKDKHSRAKALERGGAYHLPNEVHKHLLKECNERDEQEKRDEQVEEVRHCARHILFIVTCMLFNLSSLYIPTMEKAKKRKVCMCHTLYILSSANLMIVLDSQNNIYYIPHHATHTPLVLTCEHRTRRGVQVEAVPM